MSEDKALWSLMVGANKFCHVNRRSIVRLSFSQKLNTDIRVSSLHKSE